MGASKWLSFPRPAARGYETDGSYGETNCSPAHYLRPAGGMRSILPNRASIIGQGQPVPELPKDKRTNGLTRRSVDGLVDWSERGPGGFALERWVDWDDMFEGGCRGQPPPAADAPL
jgi:hypothetical protein